MGNILQIGEASQTRDFAYDALQRLTSGGTAASPESYAYDPEGNRTASHLSGLHVTDAANRLLEDDDFTYSYDANGNLTSKTEKASGAVTTYSWDARDQLVRIDFPDLTFAEYRYDGLGRRIEKNVNGTVTRYVYDGQDLLLEFDGAGNLAARYSHGQGIDRPLVLARDLDASGTFEPAEQFTYQADHLGSVRLLTDSAGLVANSYDYDSYGRIESSTETVPNPFAYTGRELDSESGLYFYRARTYDPASGRFLSEDPIGFAGADANLFRYVLNNPVNLRDANGKIPLALIGCAAGAVGGVIGGFTGTGLGGAAAVTADTTRDAYRDYRNSTTGCGDPLRPRPTGRPSPQPSNIDVPTVSDFLGNAAIDAVLGCATGAAAASGLGAIAAIARTTISAAEAALAGGLTSYVDSFIGGAYSQLQQLF